MKCTNAAFSDVPRIGDRAVENWNKSLSLIMVFCFGTVCCFFHSDLLSTGRAKSCSCFWMNHKSKNVCSLIDRFITSDSSDTLILPLTSKTGQSAVQNRQKTFLFGFYKKKQRTYFGILQAWFQTPDLKHTRDKLNKEDFLPFFISFYLCIPATNSRHPRFSLSHFLALLKL